MNRYLKFLMLAAALLPTAAATAKTPRLVVNIVVSSMRAGDIDRYRDGFGKGGFMRLAGGVRYASGEYDFMQTSTPVALATLATGALPSTHGVVSDHWYDYVANKRVDLIHDDKVSGFGYAESGGRYSPVNLLAPTIGDELFTASPESLVVTVALEPQSAIVMGGRHGIAYWMEPSKTAWSSSTHYMLRLPHWVDEMNRSQYNEALTNNTWTLRHRPGVYVNRRRAVIEFAKNRGQESRPFNDLNDISGAVKPSTAYDRLRYTPAGNEATLTFAKQLVAKYALGRDERPDILNIVLESPRFVTEAYGPESLEVEDMYYRLDEALEDFLTYLFAQVDADNTLVVLTSDHGTCPSYDIMPVTAERVNMLQTEVILNGFLNARHGQGDWVTSVHDRSVWLNRNLIMSKGLSPADIQEEVASFVIQFRGVSHALSSSSMRNSYFGSGYGKKMQNGFYPRRSGDVVINLMPGCTEERDDRRSESGSMYGYDTQVPLMFYGWGLAPQRVARHADMTGVAPTIAAALGILPPAACEGKPFDEVAAQRDAE